MRVASSAILRTASAYFCRSSSRYSGIVLVVMAKCGRNISVQAVQYWPFGDNLRGALRRCTLEAVPNRPSYRHPTCVSHPLPALRCPRTRLSDREIFSIPSHSRSAAIATAMPTIERWRAAIGRRRKREIDQQREGKRVPILRSQLSVGLMI
jgi:hypothetical protein